MNRKNRKNKTTKIKRSIPAWKRVLSGIMVLVLMSGILPLEGIAPILKLANVPLSVHAEDVQDVSNNPTIMYYEELVDYSKAYAAHPESHHENDTITIAITNGLSTDLINDFEGIGTQDNPFAGKIVINSNSFYNFNINRAFFNYVYDYVEIEAQGTNPLTINTSGDNSGAVFAEHVVHDTSSNITYDSDEAQNDPTKTLKTPASWNIKVEDYQGNPHTHSSLIGELGANAEITVSLVNNSTSSFSASSGNVGTICGTMQTGSKLTVESVTGSNSAGVSATSGNAGGLVGEMAPESELIVKSFSNTAAISAGGSSGDNKGYAGGLVGRNDEATVTLVNTAPAIHNTVTGTSGAGGLYGYYKPVMTNSAYSLSLDEFSIGSDTSHRCKVSSSGGAGGFFGVLDNPGGTITLSGSDDSAVYVSADGTSTVFGGLIGKYQATGISDTIKIQGTAAQGENPAVATSPITVNATKPSADTTAYGGIIGKVDGACFVSITDVDVTAASSGDWTFGGAVGIADTGYTFVKDFALNTSNSEAHGGGIVGSCANGVVHLAGKTDISSAKFEAGNSSYGQIVGYRDSTLVFADSSWNLTRNGTTNSVDDIGSWGEVVRFKASGFTIESVLDNYYDPTDYPTIHYAKLKGATISEDKISINSKSTFATAALNMQLNGGSSAASNVLQFTETTNSAYSSLKAKSVSMTADIDLNNTGMTGLTRDNKNDSWTSGIGPEYSGAEFDGNNHTLTLAIGAGYEGTDSSVLNDASGKGKIYTHRFNGLFGETSSAFTVKNVTITGKVHTYDRAGKDAIFYVGTIAGNSAAAFNATGVTVNNGTSVVYGTNSTDDEIYIGGLVGKMSAPGTSTIGSQAYAGTTNSTFSASITGNAANGTPFIGGVSGYVDGNDGVVNVYDVKISGSVTNSGTRKGQYIGGLFANAWNCTLNLDGVELNGLTVKGKMSGESGSTMGGLLGYNYLNTTSTFDNIKVLNCILDNDSSTGKMAGLVNMGSGYWKFPKVEIGGDSPSVNGITLAGSSAESFGMLVNRASSGDSAMYLELPSGFTYKIYNVSGTAPAIYDEIAANTMLAKTIEENGNPVVSISTNGTTKYGTMTASDDTNTDNTKVHMTSGKCNTYQNQVTTGFSKYNSNSRYYYNLDNYIGKSNSGASALYLWSVYQYAHSTIQTCIATTAPSSTFSGDLDLDGYSYYPVDVSETVNIQGTLGLHNKEIEDNESASSGGSDGFARTTLNTTKTQHYLMHVGLFRNVSGTIIINGSLSLKGTVPYINGNSGALIFGTIGGSTSSDAKISSKTGSISLSGIKVHNKDTSYSPLLINKASGYVVMDIYNVTADSTKYSPGDTIATSLIGKVGSDSAERIQVTFNGIKLDGRTTDNTVESNLTGVYGTTSSLFTKATLLHSLTYSVGSGSSGIYNYEYSEDWATSHIGGVTYGIEVYSSDSVNKDDNEYFYFKNNGDNRYITNPKTEPTTAGLTSAYVFNKFLPYVYVWGTSIGTSTTKHQLDVNHAAATFSGCGTYNHPYTIAATDADKSGGLLTISKIIDDTNFTDSTFSISLPDDISTPSRWCNARGACTTYTFNGSDTFLHPTDSSKNKSLTDVRKYLAGAYYSLSTDIEISDTNFNGLGNSSNDAYVFRGVIAGNDHTIINKTSMPLIYASNGCVVRRVTIKTNATFSVTTDGSYNTNGGAGAYGAVIGRVFGGDNIIDQVTVDFSSATISAGDYRATIGSYIGVIVKGGVFFRNMDKVTKNVLLSGDSFKEDDYGHLYCNPIIGRVLNGFAVNETASDTDKDTYAPYENGKRKFGDNNEVNGNQVSVRNNNKNYSITDLDPDLSTLSVSGTEVSVPNSQAFFVMSLIINSGMGGNGINVTGSGYYGANHTTRHADYTYVGTDTSDITSAVYLDYLDACNDDNSSPYLIENYTSNTDEETLGSGTGFEVTVSNNLILPDGYKGIGSIYYNDPSLRLALATFDGGNKNISQNTTFYSYTNDSSMHQDNYLPYQASTVHGLGLFNFIDNATFKDCILKGNVITRQYNDGTAVNYVSEQDFTGLASAMLAGTLNMANDAYISDVYLQNVKVESARDAAGLIGYLINSGKKINITNASSNTNQSNEIRVSGGTCAAGLISKQGLADAPANGGVGDITINLNNHHFDFVSIISRYDGTVDTNGQHTNWNQEWALGVGGLIGPARANNASGTNNNIEISNIQIGAENDSSTRIVACQYENSQGIIQQGILYAGGLIGIANRAPIDVQNCVFYNVNVKTRKDAGGILGWGGTKSNITMDSFVIKNTKDASICSTGGNKAGAVVGFCKIDMGNITMKNSIIDGYTIDGGYAGGVLGDWQANGTFSIINSTVCNCTVKYSSAGGGIAGQLQKSISGYNVRVSDITFTAAGTAKQGYIAGNRSSNGIIKVVGFHRTGNITEAKLVGSAASDTMPNLYGTGGYVIFADYEGKSALATPQNTTIPSINLKGDGRVTGFGVSPYITINPSITIANNIGLITGDGMSTSAVTSILSDTSSKKYTVADRSYFISSSDSSIKTDIVSTFKTELGDTVKDVDYDFPMLVVNDTTTADEVINKYLRVLTNTSSTIDFSQRNSDQISKVGINGTYSTNNATVTIKKCRYNNGTITISSSLKDASLDFDTTTGNFVIRKVNGNEQYDTATEGQFTLLDVAFKDPTTSSNPKVAYHLYVPVIVKKLVEYNFDISVLSGTTYDKTLYGTETNGIRGRALLENLGSPVTFEFDYSYLRTASEWAVEDKDYKYDKYLSFSNGGGYHFGSGTKAVLIDLNRGGVAYYLNNWTSGFNSTTKLLNLQAFTDASGTSFTPMTFQEMITAQGASFTGDATLTESYYLTIYTPKYERGANDNSTQVAHYTVASEPFTDSQHPSRRVDCETQTTRQPHNSVHLIIGDFYTNTLTVSTTNSDRMMSASNRQIGVNLSATIDVVNAETHSAIDQYLGYTDIKIYQSYLLAFEKYLVAGTKAETGISAIDDCSVDFTITRGTTNVNVTREAVVPSHNYIELQNNTDISSQLRLGAVTVNASATMSFNNDETRNAQFPKATESDNGIGALVIGSSNISSQPENTAYSTASITRQDSNSRYYYRTNEQAATLNYHADYSGATKANQRDTQLGINARELEADVPFKDSQTIYTEVRYDASGLLNADKIEYIKCTVKLYRKTGMTNNVPTYEAVHINQFLRNLTVNGTKTQEYTTYSSSDVASTEFAYVYSVSNVDQFMNEENVYKIPIVFDAISGNSTGFKDTDGYIYANYKVEVTVSAFDENHSIDATPWTSSMLNSTPTPDYVIYTNARVFTAEYVNPN